MMIKPYERQVHYYETDKMGVVHHSNYIRYFEEARVDFMRQIKCGAYELECMGIIIPTVDVYAKYSHIMRFEDRFTVFVKPASFTGARLRFEYEVVKDGETCCTGYTTHCFVDNDIRPIMLKHTNPDVYARLKEVFGD